MDNRHAARRPRFLPIAASLSLLVAGACAAAVKEPVGHVPSADVSTIVIVDLSHTLTPGFPYIPVQGVTFPFKSTPIATLEKMGVAANRWDIHEHLGTQFDAPCHFIAGGRSVDQFAANELVAPLAVIDLRERASRDPDTEVTKDDLLAWEGRHGPLPLGAAVFMYSGWDVKVCDPDAFVGADASHTLHFPGFSPDAADFLAHERDVVGIGVDTLSLDPGKDKAYRAHKTWLAADKWGVECVANLGRVPPAGATVIVAPAKVGGATGGPVRLMATYPRGMRTAIGRPVRAGQLAGAWKSPKGESLGPGAFMTREFTFDGQAWRVEAVFFGDAELGNPLFSFSAEGPYALGEASPVVPGATEAVFSFSKKSLTLLSDEPAVVERFRLGDCGLTKGVPKDISRTGGAHFTSIEDGPREFDLVRVDGPRLYLALRPADRNMSRESKRPTALGPPVVRVTK